MLASGTASHYLSPEQAGYLGGGVLTVFFFYLPGAATSPLHGRSFIMHWRALEA